MAQPITWIHPQRGTGARVVRRRQEDGSIIEERYPHTAPPEPGSPFAVRGFRVWDKMVDSAGNVVRVRITEGSSVYDRNSSYAQFQKAKHRANGWISYGECPKATVSVGGIDPYALIPSNRTGQPCQRGTFDDGEARDAKGPCPCVVAEIKSRLAANKLKMEKVNDKHKTSARLEQEAQAASAKSSQSSIEQLASVVAQQTQLLANMAAVNADAPPAATKKKKAAQPAEEEQADD